jgi:hypothetical protein
MGQKLPVTIEITFIILVVLMFAVFKITITFEEYYLLGFNATYFSRSPLTLQRNISGLFIRLHIITFTVTTVRTSNPTQHYVWFGLV